jgi:hypothetical protein
MERGQLYDRTKDYGSAAQLIGTAIVGIAAAASFFEKKITKTVEDPKANEKKGQQDNKVTNLPEAKAV